MGGIDMGTTKVSTMIAEVGAGGSPRIIGVGTATSRGLKQGVVVDIEAAAAAVHESVAEARQMAGVGAPAYNVGVAGEHIRSMNSRGVIAIASLDEEINGDDVERAIEASRKFSLPYDREIIHTLPQEYIVDTQRGIRQPAGMYGARLEARVHVVTASRPSLDNVAKTLDLAGVEIGEIVFEPLASCHAVLTADEREMGVLVLDIGGGTTDVMLYSDGGVVASGVIGLGGNNVTSDVAYGLRTSQQHAEEIKVRHGCASSCLIDGNESIEVSTIGFRGNRRLAKALLAGIIEPRMTELFSLVNDQIRDNRLKRLLGAGVVLTGGTSMMRGARELAEQVFDLPVRVGSPLAVSGLSDVVGHPRFATGVGLLFAEGEVSASIETRGPGTKRLKQSFSQLKRAIASFI
jgi:cell division protein FtsA